mgnify:CR=1 FL=1
MNLTPILLVLLIIVSLVIAKLSFHRGVPTCNNFIVNTYLYVFASLLLVASFVMLIDKNPEINPFGLGKLTMTMFLLLFVMIILVLMVTLNISPRNVFAKHLSWLLFVFLLSLVFYPTYYLSKEMNLFYSTLWTVMIMMILLTGFAFWKPELISLSIGPILLVSLLAAIVLHIIMIATGTSWQRGGLAKWLAWFLVVLFSVFILYDTKRIQVLAKNCRDVPDYINHSLSFLLDLINLFTNLFRARALN